MKVPKTSPYRENCKTILISFFIFHRNFLDFLEIFHFFRMFRSCTFFPFSSNEKVRQNAELSHLFIYFEKGGGNDDEGNKGISFRKFVAHVETFLQEKRKSMFRIKLFSKLSDFFFFIFCKKCNSLIFVLNLKQCLNFNF